MPPNASSSVSANQSAAARSAPADAAFRGKGAVGRQRARLLDERRRERGDRTDRRSGRGRREGCGDRGREQLDPGCLVAVELRHARTIRGRAAGTDTIAGRMMPRDDDGRLAAVIRAVGSALDLEQVLRSASRVSWPMPLRRAGLPRLPRGRRRAAGAARHVRRRRSSAPDRVALERGDELAERGARTAFGDHPCGPARASRCRCSRARAVGSAPSARALAAPDAFAERASAPFLLASASLTAGAIENALAVRRAARARDGARVALAARRDDPARRHARHAAARGRHARRGLLQAPLVQLYLLEEAEGRLRLRAAAPPSTDAPSLVSLRAGGRRGERLDAGTTLAEALFGAGAGASSLLVPLIVRRRAARLPGGARRPGSRRSARRPAISPRRSRARPPSRSARSS